MTSYIRQLTLEGFYNSSQQIPFILDCQITTGIDQRVSSCVFTIPYILSGLTYDTVVTIVMGAGSNNTQRFVGIVRDFNYQLQPRRIKVQCYGFLKRAIEYENTEDPTAIGGLIPLDLTTSGTTYTQYIPNGYTDTAPNIIGATLTKCNVPFNQVNIGGTSIQYGLVEDAFVWANGTNSENFDLREAGEQGLSYIERFDEVDGDVNGRFRTFEDQVSDMTGGTVRKQMTFPLSGQPDIPAFTETVDILDGNLQRSISATRNYFVVTGYDYGAGVGPEYFILPTANTFQLAGTKHTAHLSSPMIENSVGQDLVNDNSPLHGPVAGPPGQTCETVANAMSAELNREIVQGWIETFREDTVGPLYRILVSGNGGLPDRLGTGQLLYVVGNQCSIDTNGFRQRFTLLG